MTYQLPATNATLAFGETEWEPEWISSEDAYTADQLREEVAKAELRGREKAAQDILNGSFLHHQALREAFDKKYPQWAAELEMDAAGSISPLDSITARRSFRVWDEAWKACVNEIRNDPLYRTLVILDSMTQVTSEPMFNPGTRCNSCTIKHLQRCSQKKWLQCLGERSERMSMHKGPLGEINISKT